MRPRFIREIWNPPRRVYVDEAWVDVVMAMVKSIPISDGHDAITLATMLEFSSLPSPDNIQQLHVRLQKVFQGLFNLVFFFQIRRWIETHPHEVERIQAQRNACIVWTILAQRLAGGFFHQRIN